MADYPGSITSFTDQINKTTPTIDEYHLDAADFNDAYVEIVAIETELGTNPKGTKANVTARLNDVDSFLVPEYGIILWHGLISAIPSGWVICDGANNTPDLRNKFVKGAAAGIDPGGTDGSATKTIGITNLPSHNHTGSSGGAGNHNHSGVSGGAGGHDHGGSVTGGSHNHTINLYAMYVAGGPNGAFFTVKTAGTHTSTTAIENKSHSHNLNIGTISGHSHTIPTQSNHSHSVSVGYTGSGTPLNIEPAYYELIFLMKTP